jgi:hypothetical protein
MLEFKAFACEGRGLLHLPDGSNHQEEAMDLPLHARSDRPTRSDGNWVAIGRAVALVTIGVGIGVVSSIPFSGAGSLPITLLTITAASAAGIVAFLRPGSPPALVVADVLLAVAVLASSFGRLGMLYLPCLLGLLAVTTKTERRPAGDAVTRQAVPVTTEPAPRPEEFFARETRPAPRRLPERPPHAVVVIPPRPLEFEAEDPASADEPAPAGEPDTTVPRAAGRHRAPSHGLRASGIARRAGTAIRERASAGIEFVRTHLEADELDATALDPAFPIGPEPRPAPVPEGPTTPGRADAEPPEDPMEAFMLDRVAVGASMTSLTYRPYGQLRFLPPPRPRRDDPSEWAVGEDDSGWTPPGWRSLGER